MREPDMELKTLFLAVGLLLVIAVSAIALATLGWRALDERLCGSASAKVDPITGVLTPTSPNTSTYVPLGTTIQQIEAGEKFPQGENKDGKTWTVEGCL